MQSLLFQNDLGTGGAPEVLAPKDLAKGNKEPFLLSGLPLYLNENKEGLKRRAPIPPPKVEMLPTVLQTSSRYFEDTQHISTI